jgi:hypothetical protein
MNDYDPTSPHETLSARPDSSATSGPSVAGSSGGGAAPPPPPASSPDRSTSVTTAKPARRPGVRRLLSNPKSGWIAAAALMCTVIGLSGCAATSPSATAAPPSTTAGHGAPPSGFPGGPRSGDGGSNARSGPAEGGSIGTVSNMSTSSFTMSTAGGQKVTVNETSSTTYQNGTSAASVSAVTTGQPVLVLGTTNGTTITATQVIVQPPSGPSAPYSPSPVISFQRGAPSAAKQDGQIPQNYTEGEGTIVSGTTADKATLAALAAYPGGVVDRVVQLSSGEYEVHYIGVNWPHHIFVSTDFQVQGAS